MILPINNETLESIKKLKRKDRRGVALKIYAALYLMNMRKNRFGFFPVPSEYLHSINTRYKSIIDHFVNDKIIEIYGRPDLTTDIFNPQIKKYYDTTKGICMKYKFLIDIKRAKIKLDIPFQSTKNMRWYSILHSSLQEFGIEPKITRDTYGRRVHHSGIYNWREKFNGLWVIDSITSQPRLLYNELKDRNIIDTEYFNIFENELDFYDILIEKINLIDRQDAKSIFMSWAFGNGYTGDRIKHGVHIANLNRLFPIVSRFLFELKKNNYKESGSMLQRLESKIWIDDLMNNLPVEFCIPIHDCFILKEHEVDIVLDYCKRKYPNLRFKKELIEYEPEYYQEGSVLPEDDCASPTTDIDWDDIMKQIKEN